MVDYDSEAEKWQRDEPKTLSDIVARKKVFEICRNLDFNFHIGDSHKRRYNTFLDAGCGEGYFSRRLVSLAKKVIGIDNSPGMLNLAFQQELKNPLGITYNLMDVLDMHRLDRESIDVVVSNFVVHYIHPNALGKFYDGVNHVLKKGGQFVISTVHPCFAFGDNDGKSVNYNTSDFNYHHHRALKYSGTLETVSGNTLNVGGFCFKLEDHLNNIRGALHLTNFFEPVVSRDVGGIYPIFEGMVGKTPYMILQGRKL